MATKYKKLHIPTNHLEGSRPYVPPKAHSVEEIGRRKAQRRGTLVLEHERIGIQSIRFQVGQLAVGATEKDIQFTTWQTALALANSAHHNHGQGRPVMATPHDMLQIRPDRDFNPTSASLLNHLGNVLQGAEYLSGRLIEERLLRSRREPIYQKFVGMKLAEAAIVASCVPLADQLGENSASYAQSVVRENCLNMLQEARTFDGVIGSTPTAARLANPFSGLSVYMRDQAPAGAYAALTAAQNEHSLTA